MSVTDIAWEVIKTVLLPVVLAWLAAWFGVRQALKQTKRERAFDRRLQWYEKTVRAISRYSDASWKLVNGVAFDKPEEVTRLLQRLEETAMELDETADEAVLFAERARVIELREDISYLGELVLRIRQATVGKEEVDEEELRDLSGMARDLWRGFRKLAFSLAQTMRKELDLDTVTPDDLLTEEEKQYTKQSAVQAGS